MEAQGGEAKGTERRQSRRAAGLSPELIAILAVGVALAGLMLTMMTVMMHSFEKDLSAVQEEVRELQAGQGELRERMTRVESKLDVLAGDWPPKQDRGASRPEASSRQG